MMRLAGITPCICCEANYAEGHINSVYYGMPQLRVAGGLSGNQYYDAYCPKCGRGGLIQYKSAYLALKAWNEMQYDLRHLDDGWGEEEEE